MVEREVKCWTVEELQQGEDTVALLSITLWHAKWREKNEISRAEGQRYNKTNTLITKDTDLVYAGFDSHHDGVTKDFPIFRQSFPGLKFWLILQVHPVSGRCHLPWSIDTQITSATRPAVECNTYTFSHRVFEYVSILRKLQKDIGGRGWRKTTQTCTLMLLSNRAVLMSQFETMLTQTQWPKTGPADHQMTATLPDYRRDPPELETDMPGAHLDTNAENTFPVFVLDFAFNYDQKKTNCWEEINDCKTEHQWH